MTLVMSSVPQDSRRERSSSIEDHGEGDALEFTQNPEFWFTDGTIVLVAVESKVAFRVYKGVLSKHSSVFRDTFSVPQPVRSKFGDTIEGCAVVDLYDDLTDIVNLLHALYDIRRHFGPREPAPFDFIVSVLKMSDKYGMDELRQDALKCLQSLYPQNFHDWKSHCSEYISGPFNHVVALNLARLINEPSIIPTILYRCCQLDSVTLIESMDSTKGCPLERLSKEDFTRCMKSSSQFAYLRSRVVHQIFTREPNEDCNRPKTCKRIMDEALGSVLEKDHAAFESGSCNRDPLESWHNFIEERLIRAEGLCPTCVKTCEERDLESRKRIWDTLPNLLGIKAEGWATNA